MLVWDKSQIYIMPQTGYSSFLFSCEVASDVCSDVPCIQCS